MEQTNGQMMNDNIIEACKSSTDEVSLEEQVNIIANEQLEASVYAMPGPCKEGGTAFRISSKRFLITYKTHIDKVKLEEFFVDISKNKTGLKFFRVAHETGDLICPYPHSHVLVEFNRPKDSGSARVFDYDGIHPHIKVATRSDYFATCKKYLAKEDPANADLKVGTDAEINDVVPYIEQSATLYEALGKVPIRYAGIVMQVWNQLKPTLVGPKKIVELEKPWQFDAKELMMKPDKSGPTDYDGWDPRNIMWIYEPVGSAGKTLIAAHMVSTYNGDWISIQDGGTVRDLGPVIEQELERGWSGHGIIIDLPRGCDTSEIRIYQMLESLLSGMMTITKYKGHNVQLPKRPRVVVFANFMPKMNSHTISTDRWRIYHCKFLWCEKYTGGVCIGEDNMATARHKLEFVSAYKIPSVEEQAREILDKMEPDVRKALTELLICGSTTAFLR